MKHLLKACIAALCFLVAAPASAIDFAPGEAANLLSEKNGWYPSGEDNSLETDRTLYQFTGKGKNRTIHTVSTLTNIHNHFKKDGAGRLRNYVYSGQMRVEDSDGGIGVTFYSKYPKSDTYYRLRRINGNFHIYPHGTTITEGDTSTNVSPDPNQWYNFKISVRTSRAQTTMKAKIWLAGEKQPRLWQVICLDDSETRIKQGAPGVWSMGPGTKSWRRLKVRRR
jgi:hypothetical protein